MGIGGGGSGSQSVVRVEGGRGENRQVVLVGAKLFRLPRVREGLDPNPMPQGCPYIGVLPSTLTPNDSYSRVTRLMTHGKL